MAINYSITVARYAKNSIAVRCPSDDGWKTRAGRLCDYLRARWSNREEAYIMAASKRAKFEQLYAEGYDAVVFTYGRETTRRLQLPEDDGRSVRIPGEGIRSRLRAESSSDRPQSSAVTISVSHDAAS